MEQVAVWLIVGIVGFLSVRSLYRTFTGKDDACGCAVDCRHCGKLRPAGGVRVAPMETKAIPNSKSGFWTFPKGSTRGPGNRRMVPWLFAGIFLLLADVSYGGDTLEQFDPGFSDFELFFGYLGAGKEEPERGLAAETVAGIGITDWLSGYLALTGEANEKLSEGMGGFGFGAFATPLDTDHFDIDLGIDVAVGGLGSGESNETGHSHGEFTFTPFLEINWDADPDMNGFGAWLWVEHAIGGRDDSTLDVHGNELRNFTVTSGTGLLLGAYYRFLERHQIALTYDVAFHHHARGGERTFENGGASLGYNVMVVPDRLELITEARFDIPQDDEDFGTDFLLGFIATFPPRD